MTAQPDTTELRTLAEAANEGPWVNRPSHNGHYEIWSEPDGSTPFSLGRDFVRSDAAFIAAANPTRILALLDENTTLRHQLAAVRALHDRSHHCAFEDYTADPDYRGSIARRLPCPTLAALDQPATQETTPGCACGHPWDMHGPEVPGCCECRCRRLHRDPA